MAGEAALCPPIEPSRPEVGPRVAGSIVDEQCGSEYGSTCVSGPSRIYPGKISELFRILCANGDTGLRRWRSNKSHRRANLAGSWEVSDEEIQVRPSGSGKQRLPG